MEYYDDIRDDIESGDLYFTGGDTLIGSLICLVTRTKLAHVGVFKVENKRVKMLEAQIGKRISEVYASKCLAGKKIYHIKTAEYRKKHKISYKAVMANFERYVGMKYDWVGMLLSLFMKFRNKRYFCSEMTAEFLKLRLDHLNRGIIPSDIYTRLMS